MTRWLWRLGALLAAAHFAVPAAAQTNPSRLNPRPGPISADTQLSPADRGQRAMETYAECLLQRDSTNVGHFLRAYLHSREANRLGTELAVDECIAAGEMVFPIPLLRGGLFTALYRREFRRPLPTLSATEIDYRADAPDPLEPTLPQYAALRSFAECLVRADPGNAAQLILNPAGTNREKQALQRLSPHLPSCMDAGLTVNFSKAMLVALVAESLYRLSVATRAATASQQSPG